MPECRFAVGDMVSHPVFGIGKVAGYEKELYLCLFKGGELHKIPFAFEGMGAHGPASGQDPQFSRLMEAVREAMGESGWLDVELEMGKRWLGGTLVLKPGKEDTQSKEVPLEAFFKKIIGVRDKLRVLEQRINSHPKLDDADRLELQGYITRSYGSLTTFNALFADKASYFVGQAGKEE